MIVLADMHQLSFQWVKGHSGHAENEACDQLAVAASLQENLPPDVGYEEALALKNAQTDLFG